MLYPQCLFVYIWPIWPLALVWFHLLISIEWTFYFHLIFCIFPCRFLFVYKTAEFLSDTLSKFVFLITFSMFNFQEDTMDFCELKTYIVLCVYSTCYVIYGILKQIAMWHWRVLYVATCNATFLDILGICTK